MDFMQTLFEDTFKIVSNESDFNNHIINEAVIYDKLNNNSESLAKVKSKVGKYAARDNLLEDANTSYTECISCPKCAAALVIAKESNDPDYETFCKSFCVVKSLMNKFLEKYGQQADLRVNNATAAVENNPRIMNTITAVNADSSPNDDLDNYNPVTDQFVKW